MIVGEILAEEKLNIYQKLSKIRKYVDVVRKNKAGFGYKYVTEDEILARIKAQMEKNNLSLIPNIVPGSIKAEPLVTQKTKTNKDFGVYGENVNEVIVQGDMTWTWINDEDPEEKVVVPWYLVGQQSDASQAFGAALTYSSRYFLLKYFNVATSEDDPDNFRSKQRAAEAEAGKVVADGIIKTVDTYVKGYLASNPDKRDDVLKLVKKYAKSGNYNDIKEPALATKLLQDVQETFPAAT